MESYISIFNTLFATTFSEGPKTYPEVVRRPNSVQATKLLEVSENKLVENEYILSNEYLQEKAYHSSSICHKFAKILLWCFVTIPFTPILIIFNKFCSCNYFWALVGCAIFVMVYVIPISYFHHDKKIKGVEEIYTTAWKEKTRDIAKIIQDRIYAKDQKTEFRASHLAQIHRLQLIPGNRHPKSMGSMRHEMREKYTAAMKDMTSETRVMLTIYLIISGATSTVFLWAAQHYYHRPSSFNETKNYLVVVGKVVVVMIMYMLVLRRTKFWIEELERERREIMRGWEIVE